MKKKSIIIAAVVVLVIVCCGFYFAGNRGITVEEINSEQMKTVSWDVHDYSVVGASDEETLYAGVMYMNDFSDAKYFIYIKKDGLPRGWHFLRSGSLTKVDGIRAFDCGEYGNAYVAINSDGTVQTMEFEDGREPSRTENVGSIICERSQDPIHFYDAEGNILEYTTLKVLD